ncbi:MAG: LacI family DNA-binding transcriptional regulator [Phycisphaerae bacterium]|nr:LacI family DNA-binding transcriptional regulator [Phycisphaerae bacterium]
MPVASLKNVAESSGVSIATVSQVLSGGKSNIRVSAATRRKVLSAARELNYHPNIMARGLRGGKTQTVGILFSLKGPHSPTEMVQMIARKVHGHHYVSQVSDTLCETRVVQRVLRDYIRRGVDAVVIQLMLDMRIEEFEDLFSAFKAVVLIRSIPADTTADQIVLARQRAIYDAVDHFVDAGRKRPMIFVPPSPREEKIEPFLQRLQERGLVYQEEPTIFYQRKSAVTNLADVAWDALETRCPDSVPFDALLCGTDETAIAAYRWLAKRDKQVPRDVAVVGFNDSTYAKYLMPALASINRQDEEVAQLVEKMLFDRLENPDLPPQRKDVHMTFIPRVSAG